MGILMNQYNFQRLVAFCLLSATIVISDNKKIATLQNMSDHQSGLAYICLEHNETNCTIQYIHQSKCYLNNIMEATKNSAYYKVSILRIE